MSGIKFVYQINGTDDALNFSARAFWSGLWSRLHLEHLFIDRHFKSKQDISVFVLALEVTSRSSTIFMCHVWTAPSAVFGFICHLRILRRKPTAPKPPASKPMATTPPPSPKFADIIEDRFRFLDEVYFPPISAPNPSSFVRSRNGSLPSSRTGLALEATIGSIGAGDEFRPNATGTSDLMACLSLHVIIAYVVLALHHRAERNVHLKHERSRGRLSGFASRGVKKGNRRGKAQGIDDGAIHLITSLEDVPVVPSRPIGFRRFTGNFESI
ncbi:hypothetical protein HD553DRAFT_326760 [Filobasidium floriforme]|uniref:uncharacterized protein n=1 Tax=Filobasidium floriforme TaxID=5210 RepID=UPI001E8DBED5|nr:uncharacterized protein HD553DRAFT_326760 [Filobasidium floriforme]KAH8078563.1 hypothetical protein HD553DRAFT_326760 [Filobasidium floriforme]